MADSGKRRRMNQRDSETKRMREDTETPEETETRVAKEEAQAKRNEATELSTSNQFKAEERRHLMQRRGFTP